MSEELQDEVSALNSIFGDGALSPADEAATFILQLPGEESSSLRIWFPEAYPEEPPAVLGTHHSSGGRKGAGAKDLALFREALTTAFREGEVCLFDAIEEFERLAQEQREEEEAAAAEAASGQRDASQDAVEEQRSPSPDFSTMPPPPWILSLPVTESRSTFLARAAPVTSTSQAALYVQHLLATDRRARSATHNITAWRVRGSAGDGTAFQDCDDDGETAAGARVLHLLQVMGAWDVVVVVTRWYGGVKLGPRRFALINTVARDALIRGGLVKEKDEKGGKEKKKGK